jgi:intracellular sulfur oxidation DsrE/DsrF family protein
MPLHAGGALLCAEAEPQVVEPPRARRRAIEPRLVRLMGKMHPCVRNVGNPASAGYRATRWRNALRYSYWMSAPLVAAMLLLFPAGAMAADDAEALKGITTAKIAFDVHEGNPKLLLARLDVIDETRQSLIKQGVKPQFIVAFRGPATKLVQNDLEKIKPEDRPLAQKIAAKLKEMSRAPGVERFEQCAVAVRTQGTKAENVLPEVRVVGNGFISLMAYQAKGYAYIAP